MWRSWRLGIFACVAILVLGTPARALIFDLDDRQAVSTSPGSPFSPIGLAYEGNGKPYATAFLIDDCHALTSQHLLGRTRAPIGTKVVFAANVQGDASHWVTSWSTVIMAGGLEKGSTTNAMIDELARDWMVLRLSKCLGRTFGSVRLTAQFPNEPEQLELRSAGYPFDRPLNEGLAVDPSCHVRAVRRRVWFHDCATLAGNSGGPLFREVREGKRTVLEVYALDAAGFSDPTPVPYFGPHADRDANIATPVSGILPSIAKLALQ